MVIYGGRGLTCRGQAYQLLEQAVRLHWGMLQMPELARTDEGKPYFLEYEYRAFNLSHSGPLALCALDDRPVGVDIQVVKQWREGLPRRVCSGEEQEWIAKGEKPWERFTLLWALKESRVKYTGRGLREALPGIRVPIPQEGKDLYALDGMWFRIYGGDGWRGAACGTSRPPEKIVWLEALWENSPFTTDENPAIITERQ